MSALIKIRSIYEELSITERKIADYIFENTQLFIDNSSQKTAAALYVSPASLIRFAQKLGYAGLTDLKKALIVDVNSIDADYLQMSCALEKTDSCKDVLEKIILKNSLVLSRLYIKMDYCAIEKAIEILNDARRISINGIGGSGLAASDLFLRLNWLDKDVSYNKDPHLMMSSMNYLTESDALISYSISGNTKQIVEAQKIANTLGARTISITQEGKNKLSANSDISIKFPKDQDIKRIDSINSRACMYMINELLVQAMSRDNVEEAIRKLQNTRKSGH